MPRNEEVFPSRRPRILPPVISTTGGWRLGPADAADAGAAGALAAGFSCAKASPATTATTPPRTAVVVPSICRRFMRPTDSGDDSLAMLPPHAGTPWELILILPRPGLLCGNRTATSGPH